VLCILVTFIFVHQLGGIIEPNDGECHLDEDGRYTHSTLQDYPSVMQLSNKVQNNSINIIFAVTESQEDAYRAVMKIIEGSKVGVLTADSSNILELVEEQFKVYSAQDLHIMTYCGFQVQFRSYLPLIAKVFYIQLVRDQSLMIQHIKTHNVYSSG
jgi:protocadherin alpha